jgi:protein-S-isoprenylcysteine O-methyltransferase Ste14
LRSVVERLGPLFGDAYRDYCRRVKRWIPGIL